MSMSEPGDLKHVKVDSVKYKRRNTHSATSYESEVKQEKVRSISSDFVYLNTAYDGSLNSVNDVHIDDPPTSVYREQYWTCSKWSDSKKRALAIAVGIALGAAIGLALTLSLRPQTGEKALREFFSYSAPD